MNSVDEGNIERKRVVALRRSWRWAIAQKSEISLLEGLVPEFKESVPVFLLDLLSRPKGPVERLVQSQHGS